MEAKQIIETIRNLMWYNQDHEGKPILWFYCFGTLLEFIRDRTITLKQDIDIGCIYGEADSNKIITTFENMGYKEEGILLEDVHKNPINVKFFGGKEYPTIDVYFWIPIGEKIYHAYDYYKEMRKIPSRYYLKGVDKSLMMPRKETITAELATPNRSNVLTEKGAWRYDIFGDNSGYTVNCPFSYGALLDLWYPGWYIHDKNFGYSRAKYIKEIKSFKEL